MDENITYRQEAIKGLRDFADFLEANPEALLPDARSGHYVFSPEAMRGFVKGFGGRWDKVESGDFFSMERHFGPIARYDLFAGREAVCERVVRETVTRTVEEPDPELVEQLPKVKREVTEEKVEWRCPESLLSDPVAVS